MISTRTRKIDLRALRRVMIETMWLDYKLFGYTTETAKALQQRITREKHKTIDFPEVNRQEKKAA